MRRHLGAEVGRDPLGQGGVVALREGQRAARTGRPRRDGGSGGGRRLLLRAEEDVQQPRDGAVVPVPWPGVGWPLQDDAYASVHPGCSRDRPRLPVPVLVDGRLHERCRRGPQADGARVRRRCAATPGRGHDDAEALPGRTEAMAEGQGALAVRGVGRLAVDLRVLPAVEHLRRPVLDDSLALAR